MVNLVKIAAVVIFVIIFIKIASSITISIFNQVVDSITQQKTEEVKKDIIGSLVGGSGKNANVQKLTWAGHEFETAYLDTSQYKTTGNKDIKFTDNGWYAPSYSLPRSKLLDVNLNQKVKLKMTADFTGEMKSTNEDCTGGCITTEKYHFSEFGIYLLDEEGGKIGMRVLGTRHNIIQGNNKTSYKFTGLTFENTGDEIILTDSTGFEIRYTPDFKYVTTKDSGKEENKGRYTYSQSGTLNRDKKWMLGINCHVNGEGFCKLDIKDIQVTR